MPDSKHWPVKRDMKVETSPTFAVETDFGRNVGESSRQVICAEQNIFASACSGDLPSIQGGSVSGILQLRMFLRSNTRIKDGKEPLLHGGGKSASAIGESSTAASFVPGRNQRQPTSSMAQNAGGVR